MDFEELERDEKRKMKFRQWWRNLSRSGQFVMCVFAHSVQPAAINFYYFFCFLRFVGIPFRT